MCRFPSPVLASSQLGNFFVNTGWFYYLGLSYSFTILFFFFFFFSFFAVLLKSLFLLKKFFAIFQNRCFMYNVEVFHICSHFLVFLLPQVPHFSSADLLCSPYLLVYFVFHLEYRIVNLPLLKNPENNTNNKCLFP